MRIVVSSQNRKQVTGHAGMCRNFLVYEVEGGEVRSSRLVELSQDQTFHELSGQQAHPLDGAQVLITGGMGAGLRAKLGAQGIVPVVTEETDPAQAVSAYLAGRLQAADDARCAEHHHEHEHGHAHAHAHGEHGCGCRCGQR